jgi:predicted transcriptional regulator
MVKGNTSSRKICVEFPKELLETLDRIAKKEKKTRSVLLQEAAEQYAEGVRLRGASKFLREWSDEEVDRWLKQDKDSEKVVRMIRAKRVG